jgi:hypothetical protein
MAQVNPALWLRSTLLLAAVVSFSVSLFLEQAGAGLSHQ